MSPKKDNKYYLVVVSSLGLTLVIAVALGFTSGYYLDKLLNTQPWFTLIMFFVGVAAGAWAIIKEFLKLRNDK